MSRMAHVTEAREMSDLNDRFMTYIRHVRQLKDESDIRVIYQKITNLELEMKTLRSSYENQITQLKTSLEEMTKQKMEIETELATKRSSETHLLDRLSVEGTKTQKLLLEITNFKRDIQQRDQELKTNQTKLKESWLDSGDVQRKYNDALQEMELLRTKLSSTEKNLAEAQNKSQSLEIKLEHQTKFAEEQSRDLKTRFETIVVQVAEMTAKVEEARVKEAQMPELLGKVREAAEAELRRFKNETEAYYKDSITNLQTQISDENKETKRWQTETEEHSARILELRKSEADLQAQVSSLQHQKRILDETIQTERQESAKRNAMLEAKVRELQELMLAKLREMSAAKDSEVALHSEIERLKALLEEEEKRLHMTSAPMEGLAHEDSGAPEFSSDRAFGIIESYTAETSGTTGEVHVTSSGGQEITLKQEEVMSYSQEHMGIDTSGMETHVVSEEHMDAEGEMKLETPRPMPVGPVSGRGHAVGPIIAHDHGDREERTGPAPIGFEGLMEEKKETESRKSRERAASKEDTRYSGSLTNLKLLELDKEGRFISVCNSHDETAHLDGYLVEQNIGGHPVAVFRFPPDTDLAPGAFVSVWASACCDGCGAIDDARETDFLAAEHQRWATGPECTTLLRKPSGEVIAWHSIPYRTGVDPYLLESKTKRLPQLPVIPKPNAPVIKREKALPVYMSLKHPHGTHPHSLVHPSTGPMRVKTWGNDNSSLNRQTRIQTTIPDLVPGELYAGTSSQSIGYARLLQHITRNTQGGRAPEVSLRAPIGPPSPFQTPHSRLALGMEQFRSVQNAAHQPPIPRPMVAEW